MSSFELPYTFNNLGNEILYVKLISVSAPLRGTITILHAY